MFPVEKDICSSFPQPFPRKGPLSHYSLCINKAMLQEHRHPLASDLSSIKGLETGTCLCSWAVDSLASLFMVLPGYYTAFLLLKSRLFLNFCSTKRHPITHSFYILWAKDSRAAHFYRQLSCPCFPLWELLISFITNTVYSSPPISSHSYNCDLLNCHTWYVILRAISIGFAAYIFSSHSGIIVCIYSNNECFLLLPGKTHNINFFLICYSCLP